MMSDRTIHLSRATWARKRVPALLLLVVSACEPSGPAGGAASSAPSVAPAPSTAPTAAQAAPTTTAGPPAASASAVEAKEITAQHVLVAWAGAKGAPRTVKRSKADARKRAEEALAKARAGGDFAEVVNAYSDDQATVSRLGSLGKFARDGMVKPFSDAAFALPVGGISDVVESPFGFHIIKRNQ